MYYRFFFIITRFLLFARRLNYIFTRSTLGISQNCTCSWSTEWGHIYSCKKPRCRSKKLDERTRARRSIEVPMERGTLYTPANIWAPLCTLRGSRPRPLPLLPRRFYRRRRDTSRDTPAFIDPTPCFFCRKVRGARYNLETERKSSRIQLARMCIRQR